MGSWIAIHKETGELFRGKQGIYSSKNSLSKALNYWAKHDKYKYMAVEITPAIGKYLVSQHGEGFDNELESVKVF
jgi:hypothetical protein